VRNGQMLHYAARRLGRIPRPKKAPCAAI
jgi:hypothetical protein